MGYAHILKYNETKNIMKRYINTFFLLLLSLSILAQDIVLSGKILDEKDNPVQFANIFIVKDSSVLLNGFSNSDGSFEFKIDKGIYVLKVSYIGYQNLTKEIDVKKDTILKPFNLEISSNELDKVLISEYRNEMRSGIDKKIVNISEDMRRSNTNAAEILELVPIVNIDFDGNPSIPGKRSVIVLVDGRPPKVRSDDLSIVLKSIPSDKILSIEIMTNPPAKYTTSNSAVINIVTNKKPLKGVLLNAWSKLDNLKSFSIGSSLTYQYNKLSISSWGGRFEYKGKYNSESKLINYLANRNHIINSNDINNYGGLGYFGGLSPEYKINDKNIINIYIGTYRQKDKDNFSTSDKEIINLSNELVDKYNQDNLTSYKSIYFYTGIEYFKLFDIKEKELTISLDFNNSLNRSTDIIKQYSDGSSLFNKNIFNHRVNYFSFNTKYFTPIDSTSNINISFKINKTPPNNQITETWVGTAIEKLSLVDYLSYNSTFAGLVEKLTFTFSKTINKSSISFDIGQTYYHINNFYNQKTLLKKDYKYLTPKINYTYKFTGSNQIGISYKYSSSTPYSYYLNPNKRVSINGLNIWFGNPDLELEKSHNIELSLGFYQGKFNIGAVAFWRKTNNAISSYKTVDKNGVQYSTYKNNASDLKTGLQLSVSGSIMKKIKLNFGGSLYYNSYTDNYSKVSKLLGYSLKGNIMAYLPYGFSLRVNSRLLGPSLMIQGKKTGNFSLGFNIRKSLLNKRLNLILYSRDILRSSITETILQTSDFYSYTKNQRFPALLGLRANFRIGKLKEMPKSSKAMENSRQGF